LAKKISRLMPRGKKKRKITTSSNMLSSSSLTKPLPKVQEACKVFYNSSKRDSEDKEVNLNLNLHHKLLEPNNLLEDQFVPCRLFERYPQGILEL